MIKSRLQICLLESVRSQCKTLLLQDCPAPGKYQAGARDAAAEGNFGRVLAAAGAAASWLSKAIFCDRRQGYSEYFVLNRFS